MEYVSCLDFCREKELEDLTTVEKGGKVIDLAIHCREKEFEDLFSKFGNVFC